MRLDKRLAEAAVGTRRDVTRLVRKGHVTVDGVEVRDPSTHVQDRSVIAVDGVDLQPPAPEGLLLHKPAGVVTTSAEDEGPNVLTLLPVAWHARVQAVGRLDKDAEGLLLFVTDGQLLHRLTHPRWKVDKTYDVDLESPITEDDREAFGLGVQLHDGPTAPAELVGAAGDRRATMVLREGRYHQVKRMFAARGNRVLRLTRVRMGPIALDADLAPAAWRLLTPVEMSLLYAAVGLRPGAAESGSS